MPLENLEGPDKFLDALNRLWPLGTDEKQEGDDHIRGIKNVTLNSFPTVAEVRYPVSFVLPPSGEDDEKKGAVEMAVGADADRPNAAGVGALRWSSEQVRYEYYDGGDWSLIAQLATENSFKKLTTFNDGVVAEPEGQDPALFNLGPGTFNAEKGYSVNGNAIPWAYGNLSSLTSNSVYLTQDDDALELANTIEVMLVEASGSVTSIPPILRVGGASAVATGYVSAETTATTAVNTQSHSDGFYPMRASSYAGGLDLVSRMKLARLHPTLNYWHYEAQTNVKPLSASATYYAQGYIDLGATALKSLQLVVTSGTLSGQATYRFQ